MLKGGESMAEIRCTVSDCHYWDDGNKCAAELIWVTLNRFAGEDDMEISQLEDIQTVAKRSSETCCSTYKPKTDKS